MTNWLVILATGTIPECPIELMRNNHTIKQVMNIVRSADSDSEVEQLPNQLRFREFDVSIVDNQFGQKTKLAIE